VPDVAADPAAAAGSAAELVAPAAADAVTDSAVGHVDGQQQGAGEQQQQWSGESWEEQQRQWAAMYPGWYWDYTSGEAWASAAACEWPSWLMVDRYVAVHCITVVPAMWGPGSCLIERG
jgi:hypothetical protein